MPDFLDAVGEYYADFALWLSEWTRKELKPELLALLEEHFDGATTYKRWLHRDLRQQRDRVLRLMARSRLRRRVLPSGRVLTARIHDVRPIPGRERELRRRAGRDTSPDRLLALALAGRDLFGVARIVGRVDVQV